MNFPEDRFVNAVQEMTMQLHLSPVKNEFFLEGKTHGLVIFPSMSEDDHKLDENPPTFQGFLVVLQNKKVPQSDRKV